jgi:putative transposase
VRKRGGRTRALSTLVPMEMPHGPNVRGSMAFVSDTSTDGRRYRVLVVVDDFTREYLGLIADASLSGARTMRELDRIIERRRDKPQTCVSGNGTEITCMAILKWTQCRRVGRHYIAAGQPQQNTIAESFIGRLRDECLKEMAFS